LTDVTTSAQEDYSPPGESPAPRKPAWLKIERPTRRSFFVVADILERHGLDTICRSARCPNAAECWSEGTATFLILGTICTRNCAFCAVPKGAPAPPRPGEPAALAAAVREMRLRYVVITSVTRDDLADGGAAQFAAAVRAVRAADPDIRVEVLVPDFGGDARALGAVLDAGPAVLNHNIETPEAVYPRIGRPLANYRRSLGLLREAKARGATTKSGLMIGLGETREEIARALEDLRQAGCDLLTVGQYLQPSRNALPAARYYAPAEFEEIAGLARGLGFREAAAGPLVRSSYHAQRLSATLPPRT
jgi:lipoic acid synthetase